MGRVKSMRGLDDSKPEENDGVRVREREAILVNTRVRGWMVGRRACDEAKKKREREEREKERERYIRLQMVERKTDKKEAVESEGER